MKIMIVVTHLLGTGHLARALMLARGAQEAEHQVQVISGGMPAPHLMDAAIPVIQLPPVKSNGVDFTLLLGTDDTPVTENRLAQRRSALCTAFDHFSPDVLITELFPFGRRILRDEFTPLLEHAKTSAAPPLICASVRDILAPPSKPKKAAFADDMIARFYDAILCHGDASLTPLTLSWPVADAWRDKLIYTGFVSPPAAPNQTSDGADEIIVSAGGGNVGRNVFTAALAAAAQDTTRRWRLLIGGSDAAADIARFQQTAPANAIIEPARPDFRAMLPRAACSVSLCGYNTALDVLRAGCPAVFIPFDDGNEVEQSLRAKALSHQDGIEVIAASALTGTSLRNSIRHATAAPKRAPQNQALNGAAETAHILENLMETRDAR